MPRLSKTSSAVCFRIRDFIRNDLQINLAGQKLLMAFSHGADSTALLVILEFLRSEFSFDLHAMHIDHSLRAESAAEAEKAAAFCRERGIPFSLATVDVGKYAKDLKLGLEDAGRRLRHNLLAEERLKIAADWIVTAHHLDDLGEDMLLRLLRGTSWPALAGMCAVDSQRYLLRPLLLTEGNELKSILTELELPWLEDPSNAADDFKRNRLRHGVMPLLKKENPSLGKKMADLWRMARDDEEHWHNYLACAMQAYPPQKSEGAVVLPRRLLQNLDRAARMRLYALIIYELGCGQPLAESIFQMDKALQNGRGRTVFQFPGLLAATVLRGEVIFSKKQSNSNYR